MDTRLQSKTFAVTLIGRKEEMIEPQRTPSTAILIALAAAAAAFASKLLEDTVRGNE